MDETARMLPVLEHARNDGQEHVMRAVRRPVRGRVAADVRRQLDVGDPDILPGRPEVRGLARCRISTGREIEAPLRTGRLPDSA